MTIRDDVSKNPVIEYKPLRDIIFSYGDNLLKDIFDQLEYPYSLVTDNHHEMYRRAQEANDTTMCRIFEQESIGYLKHEAKDIYRYDILDDATTEVLKNYSESDQKRVIKLFFKASESIEAFNEIVSIFKRIKGSDVLENLSLFVMNQRIDKGKDDVLFQLALRESRKHYKYTATRNILSILSLYEKDSDEEDSDEDSDAEYERYMDYRSNREEE
jgi:hypothetical protein